ncbi:MAG: single-stranded-DNA-specific exonuclease RecJ [Sulfuricellaceae bacterium]|nr:single-stranded-DNA-specific exonuclease RecJ [Sulfuricellaceae bacterium]
MPTIAPRPYSVPAAKHLASQGCHPVMARIFAARTVSDTTQLEYELKALQSFHALKGAEDMALRLAEAIDAGKRLLIVADYDSDGATACAVAVRALRLFGATVDYLVPNRFEYGYGLTPEIVQLAQAMEPDILVTVDNGISSVAGVAEAHRLGMDVLVTDHHLPGDELPLAACIVNPNQPGCGFPSKNLAGVGVIFYVMLALRAELRRRGRFGDNDGPNLAQLLDLVALGTVADVVKLDDNNRILVSQGLKRMRAGRACAGIQALFKVAGRDLKRAASFDLGFMIGPRLNAAGRLTDMSLGIECLTTDDPQRALEIARELDSLNRERREIEADMQESALAALEHIEVQDSYTLSLFDPDWHQGVIGILASRLKDKFHRPALVFAPGNPGEIKGSGRSIAGLHLRDALDLVAKRHPELLQKFGGHAFAAGLTLRAADFDAFAAAFEEVAQSLLSSADLERVIETDGELAPADLDWELAAQLDSGIWGQGFPEPAFHGVFGVAEQRVVGGNHLKLKLDQGGTRIDAILFHHAGPLPERIRAVYALSINEFNGASTLQLIVRHWEAEK